MFRGILFVLHTGIAWNTSHRRGIKATIPERVDQLAGRGRRRERPCGFDKSVHRRRNVVERCFQHLKQRRGLATRYGKHPERYLPAVTLTGILIRLVPRVRS
ncbi:transposase [Streptomyces sp. bgisy104]|uniref:transposase n=1 Tax=Streptomyces sp. bgisy104 TaxID=3413785 RepID=UPI003EBF3E5B